MHEQTPLQHYPGYIGPSNYPGYSGSGSMHNELPRPYYDYEQPVYVEGNGGPIVDSTLALGGIATKATGVTPPVGNASSFTPNSQIYYRSGSEMVPLPTPEQVEAHQRVWQQESEAQRHEAIVASYGGRKGYERMLESQANQMKKAARLQVAAEARSAKADARHQALLEAADRRTASHTANEVALPSSTRVEFLSRVTAPVKTIARGAKNLAVNVFRSAVHAVSTLKDSISNR